VPDNNRYEKLFYTGIITAIILGLYLSSLYSYILFHSLIEIFTITIGFTLFILTWNAQRFLTNGCLKFLGFGYFFIALIDLLHTLAYKGMGVFPGFDANLPTQLWIAARYLQSVTLCAAPLFVERKVDNRAIFGGYVAAISVLVAMVYTGIFPDCYIEGKGLTHFKVGSEYAITALLLTSLYLIFRERKHFNDRVFFLIASSIACTAVSEISFTAYLSVYGFSNMVGHFSKLTAFFLIYRAILVTGLKEPFNLIFRNFKQAEEALRKSRDSLDIKVTERTAELQSANEKMQQELAERKRAEEALSRSEEILNTIVENIPDMIFVKDAEELRFLRFNKAGEELLGYNREELFGKNDYDFFPKDEADFFQACDREVLRNKHPAEIERETIQTRHNGERILHTKKIPIFDQEGRPQHLLGISEDITERVHSEEEVFRLNADLEQRIVRRTNELEIKQLELQESQQALMNIVEDLNLKTEELVNANSKLLELDRLKSMFIASMSHELRTPLNSIIGFSSIIRDEWIGPVNPEQKENLDTIQRSGKHLLSLINDVIDVSKIEAGRIEARFEEFDLYDLLTEAIQYVEKDLRGKGLELHLDIDHHPLCSDRRRLLQCVINLLSNAVKFTEHGKVTVSSVGADIKQVAGGQHPSAPSPPLIEISIEDSGIGIAEEDIPRLFMAFERLESPLKATVLGTGLGLYLTRKLVVDVLGGDILCKSEVGRGSTFTLRIPERIYEKGTGSRG
jgi:PAS domain S-box-containing protein